MEAEADRADVPFFFFFFRIPMPSLPLNTRRREVKFGPRDGAHGCKWLQKWNDFCNKIPICSFISSMEIRLMPPWKYSDPLNSFRVSALVLQNKSYRVLHSPPQFTIAQSTFTDDTAIPGDDPIPESTSQDRLYGRRKATSFLLDQKPQSRRTFRTNCRLDPKAKSIMGL